MSLSIYTAKVGITVTIGHNGANLNNAPCRFETEKKYMKMRQVFAFCLTFLPDGGSSTSTETLPLNLTMQVRQCAGVCFQFWND